MASKHEVKVRRAYDEPERADGARVLVDRIWPRGLSKEKADHSGADVEMVDRAERLSPS